MPKTRVVVVDDSALVRSLLGEIINRQSDMECIGAAADPLLAREMIRNLNPDVITLDVEMPRMDGIDFLGKLMRLRPMPVVMVSTLTERGADVTLRALELGAVDFVAKPKIGVADGLRQLADDITDKIRVKEAQDGERILPGHGYIAPGGMHFSVERSGANYIARVQDGEPVNRHKPSVEVLFKSAARVVGPNALGIMLTGMGADGAKAMKELRDAGSYNYVQDEATCVVFGMPREAINAGAAHEVLPLTQIAPKLIERLRSTAGLSTTRV